MINDCKVAIHGCSVFGRSVLGVSLFRSIAGFNGIYLNLNQSIFHDILYEFHTCLFLVLNHSAAILISARSYI